jgi:hypothetical protein
MEIPRKLGKLAETSGPLHKAEDRVYG